MARLLQAGWETGDVTYKGGRAGDSTGVVSVVSSTPTPASPSVYCLKAQKSSLNNAQWTRLGFSHASKSELYIGFSFYRNNPGDDCGFLWLDDTVGNSQLQFRVMSDGVVKVYISTSGGAGLNWNTLAGTSTLTIPLTTWVEIEVHLIASTTTGGTCEIKVNGTSFFNLTSQRTAQTNANYGKINIGLQNYTVITSTPYVAFDNFRVNDTTSGTGTANNSWTGAEIITLMKPDSAGDSAQFTRGGADSGANWSQMDDVPPNGRTDYVYDSVVGHLDLYNTNAPTIATVSAVDVIAQLFNSDGAGGTVSVPIKTGAGQTDGPTYGLGADPAYVTRIYDGDPGDSAAWTQAKLNALQVGLKVVS